MKPPHFIRAAAFIVLMFVTSVALVAAQEDANQCEALVDRALAELATVCADLERGQACYGSSEVSANLFSEAQVAAFSTPGDRINLTEIESIKTSAINVEDERFGVSLLNVTGSIPEEAGEHGIILIPMGGLEIRNAVQFGAEGDVVVASAETIVLDPSAVYTAPNDSASVITNVGADAALQALNVSEDGEWVRVISEGKLGWVQRAVLPSTLDVDELPIYSSETFTPMQAFYVSVADDKSTCVDVPPSLLIQGPADAAADIVVNNVPIRIESTLLINLEVSDNPPGVTITLRTISGIVTLFPDSPDAIFLPPGFITNALLPEDLDGDLLDQPPTIPVDGWLVPRPPTEDEIALLDIIAFLPENILYYQPESPVVVVPSGRGVLPEIAVPDTVALNSSRRLCLQGTLTPDVCRVLGL